MRFLKAAKSRPLSDRASTAAVLRPSGWAPNLSRPTRLPLTQMSGSNPVCGDHDPLCGHRRGQDWDARIVRQRSIRRSNNGICHKGSRRRPSARRHLRDAHSAGGRIAVWPLRTANEAHIASWSSGRIPDSHRGNGSNTGAIRESCHVLGYTPSYAVANILLTIWGVRFWMRRGYAHHWA